MSDTFSRVNNDLISQFNYGTMLLEKKKYVKAISEFKKLIKVHPNKETYLNIGNAYRFMGDERSAVKYFRMAASEKVEFLMGGGGLYALAENNIGLYKYSIGDTAGAVELYRRALSLDPAYTDATWNLASALLRQACSGDKSVEREGLDCYEARFVKKPPVKLHVDVAGVRMWGGGRCNKLVVLAEQGLGDNFMWARYLPLAALMCKELWVQCDNSMKEVFSGYTTCFNVSDTGEFGPDDYAIPMGSLSRAFEISSDNWDWLAGKFGSRGLGDGVNIGIVWAGSSTHANDANRSVPMHRFHKLARYGKLWSLSPGFKSTKYINGLPIEGWKDTLEYINSMDLIITVDTSVVHAAGALGARCWLLQPAIQTDFRWGDDSMGSKNVWYPSVSVYRNDNDWDAVFNMVEQDLKDLVGVV